MTKCQKSFRKKGAIFVMCVTFSTGPKKKEKVLSKGTSCSMDGVFLGCNAELAKIASDLPKKVYTLHYTLCNWVSVIAFSRFRQFKINWLSGRKTAVTLETSHSHYTGHQGEFLGRKTSLMVA